MRTRGWMRYSQVLTCPLWGWQAMLAEGGCCWTCCRSMSATAAAITSEQHMTCDHNIRAKITSKCAGQQLVGHARHTVLPGVYAHRDVASWLFWTQERLHFVTYYCI